MLVTTEGDRTLLYGADWCPDCRRAKSWLRRHDVPFVEYDTAADPAVREQAAAISGGPNIPVVVTPDGAVLVEPTNPELAAALAAHRALGGRSRCR